MTNFTNVFSSNADSRTLAPAAVGSQVLLMGIVSVRPSVSGYNIFALYPSRIGCHYHFIQHPTPKQQGEKFYYTIARFHTRGCTRSFMSLKSSITSVTSSHHQYLQDYSDGFPHFFIQRNLNSSTRLASMPQPSFASSG